MLKFNIDGNELDLTFENLHKAVKSGHVVAVILKDRRKLKLFNSICGNLCYYKKGSIRKGNYLYNDIFENIKQVVYKDTIEEFSEKLLTKQWNIIDKYRRYGEKTWFMVYGFKCAKRLPKTRKQWEEEGYKSLYEYGITSGVANEGKVITLESIGKKYPHLLSMVRDAISNKTEYSSGRLPFRGYEMRINIQNANDGNENNMVGFLSMEYKGCGNGHYYCMINEDCFIYCDKD